MCALLFGMAVVCEARNYILEGDAQSSYVISEFAGQTFTMQVSNASSSVTARSTFTTIAAIVVQARMYYKVPGSIDEFVTNQSESNSCTALSATATVTGAIFQRGFGGHFVQYNGQQRSFTTKVR